MPQTVAFPATIPEDVSRFCAAHDLLPDLHLALRLAEEAFAPVHRWHVGLEADPETNEEAVIIDVTIFTTVDDALKRKRDYALRWIRSATPEAQWRIRLLFDSM